MNTITSSLLGHAGQYPVIGNLIQGVYKYLPKFFIKQSGLHIGHESWVDEKGLLQKSEDGLVLGFGEYSGKTLTDIAFQDPDYLESILKGEFSETLKSPIRCVLSLLPSARPVVWKVF